VCCAYAPITPTASVAKQSTSHKVTGSSLGKTTLTLLPHTLSGLAGVAQKKTAKNKKKSKDTHKFCLLSNQQ
jgi:hypothetical protein